MGRAGTFGGATTLPGSFECTYRFGLTDVVTFTGFGLDGNTATAAATLRARLTASGTPRRCALGTTCYYALPSTGLPSTVVGWVRGSTVYTLSAPSSTKAGTVLAAAADLDEKQS